MQSPELYYLENVLGIRQYLRPIAAVNPTLQEVPCAEVCVLTASQLNNEENELLTKMLASVEISSFRLEIISNDVPVAKGYVLVGGSHVVLPDGAPTVLLPKLSALIGNASDPGIRNSKKMAWEKLKVFKKSLEK